MKSARGKKLGVRGVLPLLLMVLLLGTCRAEDGGGNHPPLLVMAAASLNMVMPELVERFEARHAPVVDVVFGSTGNLAAQIEHGAPGDLFFSADEATIRRLAAGGRIREATVSAYATGRLALVWREGLRGVESFEDVGNPEYGTIAIANPEHAPYGVAAREALRGAGLWERLESRVVQGENVAQAYQFVRTGNADVGIVARSVLDASGAGHIAIDPDLHEPILQAAGALERSTHPAAQAFLDFVLSSEGQAILTAYGFGPAIE